MASFLAVHLARGFPNLLLCDTSLWMTARFLITGAAILFLSPALLIAVLVPHNGSPAGPQYLMFISVFPFLGTCPFPFYGHPEITLADVYYWPVLVGLATAGLGVGGLVTGKTKFAGAFIAILIFSWILTAIRLIALSH